MKTLISALGALVLALAGAVTPSAAQPDTPPSSTLDVTVDGTGRYTVKGEGKTLSAQRTRTFRLPPGRYTVKAPSAVDPKQTLRLSAGFGGTARVVFEGPALRAKTVSGAGSSLCAVLADGSVGCWLSKYWPQVAVVPGLRDVLDVQVGGVHACALQADRTVSCFALNPAYGRLNPSAPESVPGLSDVRTLAMGGQACAVAGAGQVWCWPPGQVPTVVPGLTDVTSLAVGVGSNCASRADGLVWCWEHATRILQQVTGLPPVAQMVGHEAMMCARARSGAVFCWVGPNPPTEIPGFRGATSVALYGYVPCAVMPDQKVRCGTEAAALAGGEGVAALIGGTSYPCALLTDRSIKCWELAFRDDQPSTLLSSPAPLKVGLSGNARQVASGVLHNCALLASGKTWCWGSNQYRLLGDYPEQMSSNPVPVKIPKSTSVTAGAYHTCALTPDGTVWCWGCLEWHETGCTEGGTGTTPTVVAGSGVARAVSAGRAHTCLVRKNARVACWGNNDKDQLGAVDVGKSDQPVPVPGLPASVSVSAGDDFTCALTRSGRVLCWGCVDGRCEQKPVRIAGLSGVKALTSGSEHSCALTGAGRVRCWGTPFDTAKAWQPVSISVTNPRSIHACGGDTYATMRDGRVYRWSRGKGKPLLIDVLGELRAASPRGGCAVSKSGTLRCWGPNTFGKLGRPEYQEPFTGVVLHTLL